MAKSVSQWDASDLQALIGQEETSNLEFKRSDALDNTDGNKRELAKDVSAMANAAGGVIVYGIGEKDNLADGLDQGTMQTKEWIDQVLTSNIEPKIPNVTIQRIPLACGRFAFALDIPNGGRPRPASSETAEAVFSPLQQHGSGHVGPRNPRPHAPLRGA